MHRSFFHTTARASSIGARSQFENLITDFTLRQLSNIFISLSALFSNVFIEELRGHENEGRIAIWKVACDSRMPVNFAHVPFHRIIGPQPPPALASVTLCFNIKTAMLCDLEPNYSPCSILINFLPMALDGIMDLLF